MNQQGAKSMLLAKFAVTNFRGFVKRIELKLDETSDYEFNEHLVTEGCVKRALIYGENGSGKSSLLLAMSDISVLLTDNFVGDIYGLNFSPNYDGSAGQPIVFEYEFIDGKKRIYYEYARRNDGKLCEEELRVDNTIVFKAKGKEILELNIPALEKTNVLARYEGNISFLRMIYNIGLDTGEAAIERVMEFAKNFLFFRSVMDRTFIGFQRSPGLIVTPLKDPAKLHAFESFLKENGFDYRLEYYSSPDGKEDLLVRHKHGKNSFFSEASSGTQHLLLVYSWYLIAKDRCSLFCIDEFDAYYHDDLALSVMNLLSKLKCQVILTTHHTSFMSNEHSRPDCLFVVNANEIHSLVELSGKRELRQGHNIEKLYRSGGFAGSAN